MQELVQQGEDLILPCSDPAVAVVKGFRRFIVGQDIAQAKDRNAIAVIKDERVPEWVGSTQQLGPRRREVVKVQYLPHMSYADLAQVTRNLMRDPTIAGRSYLAIDAGGVGRAYADLLNDRSVLHTRVTITGGENENEHKERSLTYNSVGKVRLLSMLNSALHVGDLTLGAIAMRDELTQELEAFEAEITAAGRMKIDGGTDFSHSDAAIALALAYWLSDHRTIGACIGETPLKGYW
ncbi:hypothetical protein [Roseobacter litoralis]|uniref:Terminase large subunit gp17-like C-terminal domain-containing protein n=1 Tax=Roseobacter litoralis (strain ATCC 49566 / DSM 6996 / JCM 21268 / NBRC 15278 / OCh 149) TaxID=391595 RepID=F7ZAQ1_ROSLO|nr:hypothetical protein [Roseobacter litoralis]AEI94247.1 hypothetical protein RLO149_c022740 [Roseobacter litoralis Och 149]